MTRQSCLTRLKRSVLPVFCLIFTLLGYGPGELYLSNRGSEEFWFAFSEILCPIILISLLAFGLIMCLILVLPTKWYHFLLATVIAVAALLMVQAVYLPNSYGSLNGTQIDWSQYNGRLIYNTAIWIVVIAAAVFWASRNWTSFRKCMQVVAVVLLLIQATTLITVGINNDGERTDQAVDSIYLTTENLYTVSGDRNTIVFILDTFDSQLMCDLLEEVPDELQNSFEDFTFYHNTSGGATRTKYAIPYILTGKTNDTGSTYSDYIRESFRSSPLFQELRTGKYSTGFYTEYGYVDRTQTEAIDNLSTRGEMHATSKWGLSLSVLKMTAFKYMPHILKPCFWMYSFELAEWRGGSEGENTYLIDDIQFYQGLQDEGLSTLSMKPAFRFIHLNGAHGPFVMNEDMQSVPYTQSGSKQQGLGSLRIVAEYIRQLKHLNLYDKATIFVMADHGDSEYVQPNYEQNPLFMVKRAETQKSFTVSDVRLSYRDVSDMMTSAVQNHLTDPENEYAVTGTRYFYMGHEVNNTYQIEEYASDGDAYDFDSYQLTGRSYTYQNADTHYDLGTLLYFGERGGATAKKHFVKGFTYLESQFVWSDGKEIILQFDIGSVSDNLSLSFDYLAAFDQYQRVHVYAGEQEIGSFIAQDAAEQSFVIPHEAVKDGILDIRFYLPDAACPLEAGTGVDDRLLGLAFRTIRIDLCDAPFIPEEQTEIQDTAYTPGTVLSFGESEGATAEKYYVKGLTYPEPEYTWSDGKEVKLTFTVGAVPGNLALSFNYIAAFNRYQRVHVFAGGREIGYFIARDAERHNFVVPGDTVENGYLDIRFDLPDALSPSEAGTGADDRVLGLAFQTMTIDLSDTPFIPEKQMAD